MCRVFLFLVLMVATTMGQNEVPMKKVEKCLAEGGVTGLVNCAALRVLRSMEKVEGQQFLQIVPGVTLMSNSTSSRGAKELKEELPSDPVKKSEKLLDLVLKMTSRFFAGKTLKIELPSTPEDLARSLEEGRGRMKKVMGNMILGFGGKMMSMIPVMFGGLTFLTAKALIVAKLAFVISFILFIHLFLSGRSVIPPFHSYGTSYGVPQIPTTYGTNIGTNNIGGWGGSGQYPYARSMDLGKEVEDESGQEYAYSAHKP